MYFSGVYVGGSGEGRLYLFGEADAVFGDMYVGHGAGGEGWVELAQAGTTLSAYSINVGYGGKGHLILRDGATISATNVTHIGGNAGSDGEATISGAGTKLDTAAIGVGYSGKGSLTVEDGAEIGQLRYVGYNSGADATVLLRGGSKGILGDLYIGSQGGTGSVTLAGGAILEVSGQYSGYVYIGAGSSLTLTGEGSFLPMGRDLQVGYGPATGAAARVTVEDGALFQRFENNTISPFDIGVATPGLVEVRGEGAVVRNDCVASSLNIGKSCAGTMLIEDEGAVVNAGIAIVGMYNDNVLSDIATLEISGMGAFGSSETYIGYGDYSGENGLGIVKVEGVGSEFLNSSGLYVGYHGTGTLNATGGALVTSGISWVGSLDTSAGVVNVFGVSEWANGGVLNIAGAGNGTLTIKNGGLVRSTGKVTIGLGKDDWNSPNVDAVGTVKLSGEGSRLVANAGLAVGGTANATLTISDKALVVVDGTLTTGTKGMIQLADGWLAIESASLVPAATVVSSYHVQVYDGSQYVPATEQNLQTFIYDGVSHIWQAGDELFDLYNGMMDPAGYTFVYAGISDLDLANAGDGWFKSPWYGWFCTQSDFSGWIYHEAHGWQYVCEGSTSGSTYLWDDALGAWIWTSADGYRWMYSYLHNGWFYYYDGVTPARRFWSHQTQGLVTEEDMQPKG
jgi:T5SS/PEP-CTERM-associated repeat protein